MENNSLRELSLELLALEDHWRQLTATKERTLPDLEEAKKRIKKAKKDQVASLIRGVIVIAVIVALFLFVRPRMLELNANLLAKAGLEPGPTLISAVFWFVIIGLAVFAFGNLLLSRIGPKQADLEAEKTYEANKQYNEKLAADRAEAAKRHEEKVKELNGLAGTKPGDEAPEYFFQVPVNMNKTYKDYVHGLEFYSKSFENTDSIGPLGSTGLGTSPIIHQPRGKVFKENRYLHFDGFYGWMKCKVSEVLPFLKQEGYLCLYENKEYLDGHPDDQVWITSIWDICGMPAMQDGEFGIFKFKEINLDDCIKAVSYHWAPVVQFMAAGIPEYQNLVEEQGTQLEDTRYEKHHKSISPSKYDDAFDIERGYVETIYDTIRIGAREIEFVEKGFLVITSRGKRYKLLYAGLTDHPVLAPMLAVNCSRHDWKGWSDYHGWITGIGSRRQEIIPDKASTIDYITKFLSKYLDEFDPLSKRPEGITPEQFRLWMEGWYHADKANKKKT